MKRYFLDMKIGKKIMLALLVASIIPIILIQSIAYTINSTSLKRKIDTLMVDNLMQVAERVNLTLDIYKNLVYQIYVDDEIIDNVNLLSDQNGEQQEIAFRAIYNRLQQAENSIAGIRGISIICPNGKSVTYDAETGSSIENLWKEYEDMRTIEPYIKVQEMPGMLLLPTQRFKEYGVDKFYFHISKCMYDYKAMEKGTIATIVMSIDESVIRNSCAVAMNEDEAEYNINFVTDEKGYMVSYPDPFFTGIERNPQLGIPDFVKVTGFLADKELAVNRYEDKENGWIYYNVYDKEYMFRDLTNTQMVFIAITFSAILFACILISHIVHQLENAVDIIIDGIKEVQKGNLDVTLTLESQDELGQIASNFNRMTKRVQNLLKEVTEAKEKQKNAQIRALEAQINPHFLYNTLDSINWMAIEKEEYEISRMLRNLGIILRYSVSKSNQIVTFGEVVDWLEKYISLQQMRFNHCFHHEINIDERVQNNKVYKLLIQPFVENAIIHGFKGISTGGILRIDIMLSEREDHITIIVEDNGNGMSKEQVESYNDRERAIKDEGENIGLHNVFSRLDMYYGAAATWKVSSMEGMGSVFVLNIPLV